MSSDPDTTEPTGTVEAKWRLRAYRTWSIVGICIIIGIILYIAGIIWQAVAVLIVTALLVFLLHGFVNRLERHGIPRWGGTTIALLLIIAVIIACFMVLIPAVVSQLTSFTQQLPKYLAQIQDFVTKASSSTQLLDGESINALLTQAVSFIRQQAGALASGLANGVMGGIVSIGNVILVTFISFICSFWILLDLPVLSREVRGLVDDKYQDDIDVVTNAFGTAVYGWAKSTLLCALITGVASWLCFLILGIPYSVVLGFLCGILYFVPYIGPMVSCAIVAIIAARLHHLDRRQHGHQQRHRQHHLAETHEELDQRLPGPHPRRDPGGQRPGRHSRHAAFHTGHRRAPGNLHRLLRAHNGQEDRDGGRRALPTSQAKEKPEDAQVHQRSREWITS